MSHPSAFGDIRHLRPCRDPLLQSHNEAVKERIDAELIAGDCTQISLPGHSVDNVFCHPMHVQKSADGYLQMLRQQGFVFEQHHVSLPYPWWSRARGFGRLERWHIRRPPLPGQRGETLVNVAARKPEVA